MNTISFAKPLNFGLELSVFVYRVEVSYEFEGKRKK